MTGNDDRAAGFGRIVNGLTELIRVLTEADKAGRLPRRGRREKDGIVVEYSLDRRVLDASIVEPREPARARSRPAEKPARSDALPPHEPVTDVFDEPEEIVVLCELPGAERRHMRWRLDGDILLLDARADDRLYRKELLIEAPLAGDRPRARLHNGVLELRFRKQV